jgi:hypothetical protein
MAAIVLICYRSAVLLLVEGRDAAENALNSWPNSMYMGDRRVVGSILVILERIVSAGTE